MKKDGHEKHHWSYNEGDEIDVIWLTRPEHTFLHRYIQYDQERMMYRCTRTVGEFTSGDLLDSKELHMEYYTKLVKHIPD